MEYAISIYKPDERVYPKDCDFVSYSKQGLFCPECIQEVYLRKGKTIKPYFAHLHASNSRQVKQCSLRVSSNENAIGTNDFIEDRGQRLKIFHEHFLSKFYIGEEKIIDDINFNYWIKSIKNENNQALNSITEDCIEYFIKNRQLMEDKYIILPSKIKDNQTTLPQRIGFQVISYLCANANFNFNLRYLLYYTIYQLYNYEKSKLSQQDFTIKDIDTICQYTVRIIMLNPWAKALDNTKNINQVTINVSQSFEPKIVKTQSASSLQISSQNIKNASQLYDLEQVKVNSKRIVSRSIDIDINQINATERHALESKLDLQLTFPAWEYGNVNKETGLPTRKQVFISCKLVTETNPDDKTALRFSFMTSQSIKIDSRVVDTTSGKYIKVASETYLPAIVYNFGYDFSLTVTTHSNLLFSKGGNLMDFPEIEQRDQLASLVESMIDNGKIDFIETYLDSKGKERVLHAYDDTVLLLIALKQRTQLVVNDAKQIKDTTVKYQPISDLVVMEAFIEAYEQSLQCSVTLPNTTIDNYHNYAQFKLTEINTTKEREPVVTEEPVVDYVGEQCVFPTNYKVAALSNSREFGVSSTVMGGKKLSTPVIYTMTVDNKGVTTIHYHYSEKIKNALTEQTETSYKKRQIASISAAPGTLKISFEKITLDKLAFGEYAFHHELLEQYSLPFWINNAENYVLANKLPPVWLVTSKLIQLTCMDENTGTLDLNSLQSTLPFTEVQWYQTLIGCYEQCPSVPQFANSVNNLPEKYQYLINPVDIKLNRDGINDRPKPTTTNRINTGLLGNWSQPFFLQLEPGQYLADKLGNQPIQCQVAMENQLLILYILDKSFTRSDAVSASHSKKSFSANLTQQRTKLLTIGTIELSEIPITKWSATQPQYETLAKLLNKSNNLPESIQKQYQGLLLTNESLSIGDRVLCKKNVIGNKVLVKSYLNDKYCQSHNQPKTECIWLDQLRNDITKKMLQANYHEVKTKVENYVINNSDTAIHKATYDVAKCTQMARSVVRQHQPSCNDSEIGRLAMLISEYIFTKLNLNKSQAVELLKSLKSDVNQYIKIRDLVITPQLDHLKENDS